MFCSLAEISFRGVPSCCACMESEHRLRVPSLRCPKRGAIASRSRGIWAAEALEKSTSCTCSVTAHRPWQPNSSAGTIAYQAKSCAWTQRWNGQGAQQVQQKMQHVVLSIRL